MCARGGGRTSEWACVLVGLLSKQHAWKFVLGHHVLDAKYMCRGLHVYLVLVFFPFSHKSILCQRRSDRHGAAQVISL